MSDFKVGDRVLVCDGFDDPSKIHEHTISKVNKDTVQCGSSENTFYSAFCWPARVRPQLEEICKKRQALKKAYDDSMKMIYELKNQVSRNEQ